MRGVIFDYGMVLTGPPDADSHAEMVALTGLSVERFESHYWADRHAYDEGKVTGLEFWQNISREAGLGLDAATIANMNRLDARMWTTENTPMVAWQAALKQSGMRTAILSNMGDAVLESVLAAFPWTSNFDVLVWSYQLRMAKPDPAIYLHALVEIGTPAEETLFLDDKLVNIEAARAVGLQALQFTTVEKLRADLIAAGLDRQLPLP